MALKPQILLAAPFIPHCIFSPYYFELGQGIRTEPEPFFQCFVSLNRADANHGWELSYLMKLWNLTKLFMQLFSKYEWCELRHYFQSQSIKYLSLQIKISVKLHKKQARRRGAANQDETSKTYKFKKFSPISKFRTASKRGRFPPEIKVVIQTHPQSYLQYAMSLVGDKT